MESGFTKLIEPNELLGILDEQTTVVLDVRFSLADPDLGEREYNNGHISGAYYLNLNTDLSSQPTPTSGRHPLPSAETLASKLRSCGMENNSQVVAYDDSNGAIAGRMWWLLRWLGHTNVAVLNGGLSNWIRQGYDVVTAIPKVRHGAFEGNAQEDLVISTAELEDALANESIRLVDARAADRYAGKHEPIDPIAGHIPGAENHPFQSNLNSDGCFKSADELQKLHFAGDNVVCMCGSGVTACHNILATVIAGNKMPKLYVGSWSEWIRDSRHQFVRE